MRWHLPGHGVTPPAGGARGSSGPGGRLRHHADGRGHRPRTAQPVRAVASARRRGMGARRTWFLANGASQGNLIAVMATTAFDHHHRSDRVVVMQRSVHSSMIDALGMSGGRARFVAPYVDHDHGVAHGVRAADVAAELDACAARGEAVDAVIVVSPSYFGFVADIVAIAGVAHGRGVPLVVDEAWGRTSASTALPAQPVVGCRPGGVVDPQARQVVHPVGDAHLADGPYADLPKAHRPRVSQRAVDERGALLLASLDIARRELATGTERIGRSIDAAEQLAARVRAGERFGILSDSFPTVPGWAATDPLRVVIDTRVAGLDGRVVRTTLKRDFGLLVELASEERSSRGGCGAVPDVEAPGGARRAPDPRLAGAAVKLPVGPNGRRCAAWLGDASWCHTGRPAGCRRPACCLSAWHPQRASRRGDHAGCHRLPPGGRASPAGHVLGAHIRPRSLPRRRLHFVRPPRQRHQPAKSARASSGTRPQRRRRSPRRWL